MKLTAPQLEALEAVGASGLGLRFGAHGPTWRRLLKKRAIERYLSNQNFERYRLTPEGLRALARGQAR